MIELKNIVVTFNENAVNPVQVFRDVSLTLPENEWVFVIGGNGSGKSTLLKVINKDVIPQKGELVLNNISVKDILLIDQTTSKNIVPSMTIYENLIFAFIKDGRIPSLKPYYSIGYKDRIIKILSLFNLGLENRLNEQVRFLSGGEQQIIVASRIMLSNPKVLLMDEFTSALDQKWAPYILGKLKSYAFANNITVIAVTHDYNQIEDIADRVIFLKDGIVGKDINKSEKKLTRDYILSIFYGSE